VVLVKTENIPATGRVIESLADYKFRIALDTGHQVIAHLCGRMIKAHVIVTPGDDVAVEISPYDLERGRVTRRF
jgi:translation initiation factor IF-1